jgi:hypothetical protein
MIVPAENLPQRSGRLRISSHGPFGIPGPRRSRILQLEYAPWRMPLSQPTFVPSGSRGTQSEPSPHRSRRNQRHPGCVGKLLRKDPRLAGAHHAAAPCSMVSVAGEARSLRPSGPPHRSSAHLAGASAYWDSIPSAKTLSTCGRIVPVQAAAVTCGGHPAANPDAGEGFAVADGHNTEGGTCYA